MRVSLKMVCAESREMIFHGPDPPGSGGGGCNGLRWVERYVMEPVTTNRLSERHIVTIVATHKSLRTDTNQTHTNPCERFVNV